MKTSDIALAIFVAFFSVLISYWLGNLILGDPSEEYVKIDYANEISSSIVQPSMEVFNPYSINPTVETKTGDCPPGEEWEGEAFRCVENELEYCAASEKDENGNYPKKDETDKTDKTDKTDNPENPDNPDN